MDAGINLEGVAGKGRPGKVALVGNAKDLRLSVAGLRTDSPWNIHLVLETCVRTV